MPSSRITTPSVDTIGDLSGLTALLGSVPDPRAKRGQRHELTRLVATGVAAVIAGARSFVAIGEWAAAHPQAVPMPEGAGAALVPDESTFRRVFACLDATALAVAIGAWLWTRTALVHGRRVIAIDGETVRGARRRDRAAPHLVAALDHASGTVLGQLAITTKSNDIAAQAAIGAAAHELHLPTIRAEATRLSEIAAREHQSHLQFLAEALSAEVDDRTDRRRTRRINEAKFPRLKRLVDFNIEAVPAISAATLGHLGTGGYLDAGEPVVLLGDPGTG